VAEPTNSPPDDGSVLFTKTRAFPILSFVTVSFIFFNAEQTDSVLDMSVTSPNPEEIRQKVQERGGDAHFRRQMEAVNRRRVLFGPLNRKYVVQRDIMPNDGVVRKMRTLSVVPGPNRVNFIPGHNRVDIVPGSNRREPGREPTSSSGDAFLSAAAPPGAKSRDGAQSVGEIASNVGQLSPDSSSTDSSSDIIGRPLGMKIQQPGEVREATGEMNFLEMAAKQSDIVPPTTPQPGFVAFDTEHAALPEAAACSSPRRVAKGSDCEDSRARKDFQASSAADTAEEYRVVDMLPTQNTQVVPTISDAEEYRVVDVESMTNSQPVSPDNSAEEYHVMNVGPATPIVETILESLDGVPKTERSSPAFISGGSLEKVCCILICFI